MINRFMMVPLHSRSVFPKLCVKQVSVSRDNKGFCDIILENAECCGESHSAHVAFLTFSEGCGKNTR